MTQARTEGDGLARAWLPRALLAAVLSAGFVAALALLTAQEARAAPASTQAAVVDQPDGSTFRARLFGDELSNGTETAGGYTILQTTRGVWQYAQRAAGGGLKASGRVVGRDTPGRLPRHLRPEQPRREPSPLPDATADSEDTTVAALSPAPSTSAAEAPAVAQHRSLVILAAFDGQAPLGTTAANWNTRFFGATQSLSDYYDEVSYGRLQVGPAQDTHGTVDDGVVGWLPVSIPHPDGDADAERLAAKAAIEASAPDVNYAAYDTDGDGYIAPSELHVTVIAAGYEGSYQPLAGGAKAVWGHRWAFSNATGSEPAPVVDGVAVGDASLDSSGTRRPGGYTMFGEMHNDHQATVGIVAHEFGHDLGWPDLYDTDDHSESTAVGNWSVMGTGSWGRASGQLYQGQSPTHPDAWSKSFQGWIDPVAVYDTATAASVPAVAAASPSTAALRLGENPGGASDWTRLGTGTGEYFLVENRQRTAGTYDAALPGEGLLIWHINEARWDNDSNANRLVALEQADGLNSLNLDTSTSRGDAGDPYPGTVDNRAFGAATNPSSSLNNGSPSGFSVTAISDSGITMTADFLGPPRTADLVVTHTAAANGAGVTYTAEVTNNGPFPAVDVLVNSMLPAGMSVASASGECTQVAPVSCDLGDLAAGAVTQIQVIASASGNGDFTATASTTSATLDPAPTNNSAPATATVDVFKPDLRLSLVAQRGPAGPGFSYKATLKNIGDAVASDATVTIILPALPEAKFRGATGMTCTVTSTFLCAAGAVDPGASKTVTVVLTPGSSGPLRAEASAATSTPETATENNAGTASADSAIICDNFPTFANDLIIGTTGPDVLCGLGGNDVLIGAGSNDLLFGGTGRDTTSYVAAPAGVKVDLGLQGLGTFGARPRISGTVADGKDVLFEVERARGSAFADEIRGRSGAADLLWGMGGADRLFGLSGEDTLYGGEGDDTVYGGKGGDTLDGGSGSDYCRDLTDALSSCEF